MVGAKIPAVLVGLAFLGAGWAEADAGGRWAVEFHLGGAWNLPLPLMIRQEGHDDLAFRSRWKTRALERPLYYVGRLVTREGDRGWALDLTHHKLYLVDPPDAVQSFAVSHGYNLLTLHRLVECHERSYGLGAGLVIAHPESEVRGQRLAEHGGPFRSGYYLAGPTVGALASWLPERRSGLYPAAEARLTVSYARVPVAGGHARVPNVALHVTVGLGWDGAR
jgi:hypothetical protein